MSRLIGLILFFTGLGMLIGMLIAEHVIAVLVSAICLLCGYHFFCR
ncbi:MAG: hypothetical protein UFJ18_05690 [Blautia sp.]|nr:hypothetical protein [Eubacteriales bacterium]MDO5362156.1 hypothetical protein [Eubacteriales bacterium]MED9966268.1 hypothetical protein [Blautia sp.]